MLSGYKAIFYYEQREEALFRKDLQTTHKLDQFAS